MKRILVLIALALSAGLAQATTITFEGLGKNVAIPTHWGSDIGTTPNVALTWSTNGGTWEFYNDSEWSAAQMDGFTLGAVFDLLFTPDAGYAVQVNSFVFDDYPDWKGGSRFIWQLFQDSASGTLINDGSDTTGDGDNLTINTGMSSAYAGPVLLRLIGGIDLWNDGKDQALDTINFTQVASVASTQTASVPEPSALLLLGSVLAGLWVCGRKKAKSS